MTVRRTVYHTSCKMFEVSEYSRVYMLGKNVGLRSNYFLEMSAFTYWWKMADCTRTISWKWLLSTSYYRMDTHFSTRSIFMTVTWHTGMKTFLVIALHEKEKTWRIALKSTAHIEEIGELEGKKSLFQRRPESSKALVCKTWIVLDKLIFLW